MHSLKTRLHQACLARLDQSIEALTAAVEEARAAQKDDTKSSAGDKFETTREMMTQEIEKNSAQLATLLADRTRLMALAHHTSGSTVQQGSVVMTGQGNFYVAVSVGAVVSDGVKFQTISLSSPIGRLLLNKKAGERFHFHDKEYLIKEIL